MALLTATPITRAGVTIALGACAVGGDTYSNAAAPYLELNNASGGALTVAAAIYADGQTIAAGRTWSIGAGLRVRIQPMTGSYTNPADGLVYLTYPGGVTTLTIGLFTS